MPTWIVVYALVVLVIVYFAFKDIKNLFFGYIFILPFYGLMVDLGINLTIDRILALIMGFVLLFNLKKINRKTTPTFLVIFLVYAFILTFIMSMYIPVSIYDPSIFRGQWRPFFQLMMFLLNFVPLVFALAYLNKISDIKKTVRIFLIAMATLAFLGLLQFVVWYFGGKNLFPIGILRPLSDQKEALLSINGANFLRICSLGGEAKHFAYSLVFALSILFIRFIYDNRQWFDLPLMLLFSLALILTFSTQGYILLVAAILVISVVSILIGGLGKSKIVFFLLALMVLLVFLLFYFYPNLWQLIMSRSFDRIWQPDIGISNVDDFNAAVLAFLAYSPVYWLIGVGWGNTQYYARDFLLDRTQAWASPDAVFSAQSGVLRIISELGVPGLLLFLVMYLKPVFSLWKVKLKTVLEKEFIIYAIFALVAFSLSQDGPVYLYVVMAIVYLLYNFRNYPEEVGQED